MVVIGILIALQINNWNEWRKDRVKERSMIQSLIAEFKENQAIVENRKQLLEIKGKVGFRLISMMKSKPESISGDSILKWHVEFSSLGPSGYNKTAIERVINNQNFELILWDSLKTMLNEYLKSVITSEKEYEKLNNNDWIEVVNKPDNFGGNRNLLSGLNDQMQAMMDYMQVHNDLD